MLQILKDYQLNYLRVLKNKYKRYIFNEIEFKHKLIGIIGARGVGKTTFLLSDYHTLYKYMEYLKRGKILSLLRAKTKGDNIFTKPDKLYLGNTNLDYAYCQDIEVGTLREVFFMSMFDDEVLSIPTKGDFLVDNHYLVEIGGKNKSFKQIKDVENSFIVVDDIEVGSGNKIPLWLFGFMY